MHFLPVAFCVCTLWSSEPALTTVYMYMHTPVFILLWLAYLANKNRAHTYTKKKKTWISTWNYNYLLFCIWGQDILSDLSASFNLVTVPLFLKWLAPLVDVIDWSSSFPFGPSLSLLNAAELPRNSSFCPAGLAQWIETVVWF